MESATPSTYVPQVDGKDQNVISLGGATTWDAIKGIELNFVSAEGTANNFTTGNNRKATVAIVAKDSAGKYVRISANHTVTIVDGKNIHSIGELVGDKNNILVSNIAADTNYTPFTLSNKTLYGNGFAIDFTGHDDTKTGITALITLQAAKLYNINLVGEVYASSEFNFQSPTSSDYGASLVYAQDGSEIKNAYLANTRSPLMTNGTVTVSGSVIFGGNYANIDVQGGTLVLIGNVTTINQIIVGVTDNTLGAGIVVDFDAPADTTINIRGANLQQFNYVAQADTSKLPKVFMDFGIEDITIEMKTKVNSFFTDSTLSSFLYTEYLKDADGNYLTNADGSYKTKKYFNAGIIFLNGAYVEVTSFGHKLPMSEIVSLIGVQVVDSNGGIVEKSDAQIYGTKTLNEERGPTTVMYVNKVYLNAKCYFHIPMPDANLTNEDGTFNTANTNNGVNFNNDASAYIPSNYLPN